MAPAGFVDAHAHLWGPELLRELAYGWLDDPDDGLLGSLGALKAEPCDAARYRDEAEAAEIVGVIAMPGSDGGDGVREVGWIADQQARTGLPHAIVARPDMLGAEIESELDALAEASELVRGVRDMSLASALDAPRLPGVLRSLERRSLSWDLHCFWDAMSAARTLAAQHPGLQIALGHAGFPLERSPEYFDAWRHGISELAEADNVSCKISGLGMADHEWSLDSWRPWVLHCVESFGIDRCLVGSNWPIDALYRPLDDEMRAFDLLLSDLTIGERDAIFRANAARFYRIETEVADDVAND